jgi:hypothetical protein
MYSDGVQAANFATLKNLIVDRRRWHSGVLD